MHFRTRAQIIFQVFNYLFIILVCLSCILPLINLLAISFSSPVYVAQGSIGLLPRGFTTSAYEFAFMNGRFMTAFWISIQRVVLGVGLNMFLLVTTSYPLSKPKSRFLGRNIYMGFYVITMLFGGGLIPWYILMLNLGLFDSIWALVLPLGLPVTSMLILMNFMRNLPGELEEAALIDGAGHFTVLFVVLLPILKPALATVALFAFVFHWNDWLSGMLFMNDPANYPLQTYLQTLLVNFRDLMRMAGGDYLVILSRLNEQSGRAAQLFLGLVPLMVVYPFLQKYFTRGLVLGSVKG